MTDEEKAEIDKLSHREMARLYRFSPSGHKYFISGTQVNEYFMKRFMGFGGITSKISKEIGW